MVPRILAQECVVFPQQLNVEHFQLFAKII